MALFSTINSKDVFLMIMIFFNWREQDASSYESFPNLESAMKYCKKHLSKLSQINRTYIDSESVSDSTVLEAVLESYIPRELTHRSEIPILT